MFRSPRMSRFVSSLAVVGSLCITATQASAITLPDPEGIINGQAVTIQYGDFYSYSLPILNALTGTTDYTVQSSPGQLGQALVIASHPLANGQNNHNTGQGYTGVDNVFQTPNGNGGSPTFNTTAAPDPGGAGQFVGDSANSWDIRLSTLSTYLGSEDLVFFFNHNQTNANQDLQVRAQVVLSNDDGTQTQVFKFGDGVTFDDYVTALGQFNSNIGTINHNLGANDVAYAVFSPVLNQIIKTAGFEGYTVMQVSLDMIDLNNGYEQLFISPTAVNVPSVVTPVPEPMTATMGLLGMAGVALGLRRRR